MCCDIGIYTACLRCKGTQASNFVDWWLLLVGSGRDVIMQAPRVFQGKTSVPGKHCMHALQKNAAGFQLCGWAAVISGTPTDDVHASRAGPVQPGYAVQNLCQAALALPTRGPPRLQIPRPSLRCSRATQGAFTDPLCISVCALLERSVKQRSPLTTNTATPTWCICVVLSAVECCLL